MLDVRLFRNPRFSAASGAIALAIFGLFGFIFLITQHFQVVRGYDPLHAGVATLPFAIVTGAVSPAAIAVMKRAGTKAVVTAGLALMSIGFVVAAGVTVDSAYWGKIIISMALIAAGRGLTTSPATDAIMGALPRDKAGAGSAVNDTTRDRRHSRRRGPRLGAELGLRQPGGRGPGRARPARCRGVGRPAVGRRWRGCGREAARFAA
jgi:MFS transporter, DHA2 family, multidrug resistance protein